MDIHLMSCFSRRIIKILKLIRYLYLIYKQEYLMNDERLHGHSSGGGMSATTYGILLSLITLPVVPFVGGALLDYQKKPKYSSSTTSSNTAADTKGAAPALAHSTGGSNHYHTNKKHRDRRRRNNSFGFCIVSLEFRFLWMV